MIEVIAIVIIQLIQTGDRHLAVELRGMNLMPHEEPKWKNAAFGNTVTFGKIDNRLFLVFQVCARAMLYLELAQM